jgi:hypothetical protein
VQAVNRPARRSGPTKTEHHQDYERSSIAPICNFGDDSIQVKQISKPRKPGRFAYIAATFVTAAALKLTLMGGQASVSRTARRPSLP